MSTKPSFDIEHIPAQLHEPDNAPLLAGIMRGVEKESLRVTANGHLANSPHPTALGSALTHPQITTDFSEALLEFITPPSHRLNDLHDHLRNIHAFAYHNLGEELLWSNSMPCPMGSDAEIPVARYGATNRAQMKTIYRVGLGHRYGRVMQTVAGIHYNFSLPSPFWAFLHQSESPTEDLREFTTRRYFDLIRNFRRHYWLLIYLFGASPAMCASFVRDRVHDLSPIGKDSLTLHRPYATSLRMGDLGYQSSAQENLFVCYNARASYVETLCHAINTPYAPYAAIGLKDDRGDYRQLNTSLLQIENEFYSAIRPKRTARAGETALSALCRRGVEYIEVRCLDIDPFNPLGIDAEQVRFLDTFLVYCLLKESPYCDNAQFKRILANQKRVVNEGRRPGLELAWPDGGSLSLQQWGRDLLQALAPVAELLDRIHGGTGQYQMALRRQMAKVENPELTPSAQVLRELQQMELPFATWALRRAEVHRQRIMAQPLPERTHKRMTDMAEESLALQQQEETEPQTPLDEYLANYYQQYRTCCRT